MTTTKPDDDPTLREDMTRILERYPLGIVITAMSGLLSVATGEKRGMIPDDWCDDAEADARALAKLVTKLSPRSLGLPHRVMLHRSVATHVTVPPEEAVRSEPATVSRFFVEALVRPIVEQARALAELAVDDRDRGVAFLGARVDSLADALVMLEQELPRDTSWPEVGGRASRPVYYATFLREGTPPPTPEQLNDLATAYARWAGLEEAPVAAPALPEEPPRPRAAVAPSGTPSHGGGELARIVCERSGEDDSRRAAEASGIPMGAAAYKPIPVIHPPKTGTDVCTAAQPAPVRVRRFCAHPETPTAEYVLDAITRGPVNVVRPPLAVIEHWTSEERVAVLGWLDGHGVAPAAALICADLQSSTYGSDPRTVAGELADVLPSVPSILEIANWPEEDRIEATRWARQVRLDPHATPARIPFLVKRLLAVDVQMLRMDEGGFMVPSPTELLLSLRRAMASAPSIEVVAAWEPSVRLDVQRWILRRPPLSAGVDPHVAWLQQEPDALRIWRWAHNTPLTVYTGVAVPKDLAAVRDGLPLLRLVAADMLTMTVTPTPDLSALAAPELEDVIAWVERRPQRSGHASWAAWSAVMPAAVGDEDTKIIPTVDEVMAALATVRCFTLPEETRAEVERWPLDTRIAAVAWVAAGVPEYNPAPIGRPNEPVALWDFRMRVGAFVRGSDERARRVRACAGRLRDVLRDRCPDEATIAAWPPRDLDDVRRWAVRKPADTEALQTWREEAPLALRLALGPGETLTHEAPRAYRWQEDPAEVQEASRLVAFVPPGDGIFQEHAFKVNGYSEGYAHGGAFVADGIAVHLADPRESPVLALLQKGGPDRVGVLHIEHLTWPRVRFDRARAAEDGAVVLLFNRPGWEDQPEDGASAPRPPFEVATVPLATEASAPAVDVASSAPPEREAFFHAPQPFKLRGDVSAAHLAALVSSGVEPPTPPRLHFSPATPPAAPPQSGPASGLDAPVAPIAAGSRADDPHATLREIVARNESALAAVLATDPATDPNAYAIALIRSLMGALEASAALAKEGRNEVAVARAETAQKALMGAFTDAAIGEKARRLLSSYTSETGQGEATLQCLARLLGELQKPPGDRHGAALGA